METDTDLERALSTPDQKEDQTRLRFSWGGHTMPLQQSLPALCHGGPMGHGLSRSSSEPTPVHRVEAIRLQEPELKATLRHTLSRGCEINPRGRRF